MVLLTLQAEGVDESLDQVGIYVPTQVSTLCTVLCLFTMRLTHLLLCVAALQEQRVAFGTRYEVSEVSVTNKYCKTLFLVVYFSEVFRY